MATSSLAGVITACASLFTACALVITALAALARSRRVERKVDEVHVIVNQAHTDLLRYQRALVSALQDAQVAVPADQSVEPPRDPKG